MDSDNNHTAPVQNAVHAVLGDAWMTPQLSPLYAPNAETVRRFHRQSDIF